MIPRPNVIKQIARALTIHPVAALLGPRQCGKTTVARLFAEREPFTYFDLENPVDVRRAPSAPPQPAGAADARRSAARLWLVLDRRRRMG